MLNEKKQKKLSREEIHEEDIAQVKKLEVAFNQHCAVGDMRDRENDKKIDKLLPLVELIPTIQSMVEDQKATVYLGRKILRVIGAISAVVGLAYLILQFWREVKQ